MKSGEPFADPVREEQPNLAGRDARQRDLVPLASLASSDEKVCDDVLILARNRLADLRARIKDLNRIEKTLARSLELCCKGERGDLWSAISRFTGRHYTCTNCPPEKKAKAALDLAPRCNVYTPEDGSRDAARCVVSLHRRPTGVFPWRPALRA